MVTVKEIRLINGHLSYYFQDEYDIAIYKRIYEVLRDNPDILIEFKNYLMTLGNKYEKSPFVRLARERHWHVWCSLIGLTENKTVSQIVIETGPTRERIRQIMHVTKRKFGWFMKKNDYQF